MNCSHVSTTRYLRRDDSLNFLPSKSPLPNEETLIAHEAGCFAGLGFLAWYSAGKIRVFDRLGHIAKLCIVLAPSLLCAALVAISRVDGYWYHCWQDVFAGGLLGLHCQTFSWGRHAYFQVLADSGTDGRSAAIVTNSLSRRQTEFGTYLSSNHIYQAHPENNDLIEDDVEGMGVA